MKTILIVTQVYVPDPASVGQHMADAAEELARRGHRVIVFSANRGYDNPEERFPGREQRGGVEIFRLPFSSLGKRTIVHRLAGQLSFCLQAFVRGLFVRRLEVVLVTTSPPMGSVVGWAISLFRRVAVKFWVMDINPDQTVRLGKAAPSALSVRIFDWFNRRIIRAASDLIVLDRFMAETMQSKVASTKARFHTMPPWPMEGHLERIEHAANPFRREHGLEGKFVIMYSGNHSLAHPLDTVLEAAKSMRELESVVFLFVGGGRGKQDVDAFIVKHQLKNVRSLPYQPIETIKYSLSAADLHLVSMGESMVGIVHPCKFYGAMALAKPIFLIGPDECHVQDVLSEHRCGWSARHGDVDGAEAILREVASMDAEKREAFGMRGYEAIRRDLGRDSLMSRLCDVAELDAKPNVGGRG